MDNGSSCGKPHYRRQYMSQMAGYTGQFKMTNACDAPCTAPGFCCLSCLCHQCVSYNLRVRALHDNINAYQCCGGFHPCAGRNCFGEQSCPATCLCCEVTCCFPSSVMSTRLMLQQEMQIQNSKCDDDLMCCITACECAACIISMFDEQYGDLAHTCADSIYYSTCACFQTQHKIQLDARDAGETTTITMNPPQQVMYAAAPPQGMYVPPQPVYAQPQGVMYAPPQPQYAGRGQTMMGQPVYGVPPGQPPPGMFRPPPQQPPQKY